MAAYFFKRLLMIPLTLFGIMVINFAIIQFAPGGPIDYWLGRMKGENVSIIDRLGGDRGQAN